MNYGKNNIAVISIYSFPYGLAPTSRIIAYAKGMVENGVSVTVYLPFPTDNYCTSNLLPNSGTLDNIRYLYTSGRYKGKFKIFRGLAVLSGFRKFWGYITAFYFLMRNSIIKQINCIIISTDSVLSLFVFAIIAKLLKSKSIFIFDEYPMPIRHKLKDRIPIWKEYLYRKVLNLFNGYVSISENLKKYYEGLTPKKTLIISNITDVTRFNISVGNEINRQSLEHICYMGNMELSKDNVDNIIKAFSLISDKHPVLQLHLYGNPNNRANEIMNNLIQNLNLGNRVIMKGIANYNDVPNILKCAKILVSSQPDTRRASGGFPTKMGEYLATGVPTLLTDVGENSNYVVDKKHIFFSKPDDPEDFAQKLDYILNNYDFALQVAQSGKEFLYKNYSHFKQGQRLIEFCQAI